MLHSLSNKQAHNIYNFASVLNMSRAAVSPGFAEKNRPYLSQLMLQPRVNECGSEKVSQARSPVTRLE
jgi:hypothetical protein